MPKLLRYFYLYLLNFNDFYLLQIPHCGDQNGFIDNGYVIPQFDGGNDSFGDDDTDLVPSIQSPMKAEDSTSAEYVKVCKVSCTEITLFFKHNFLHFPYVFEPLARIKNVRK